MLLEKKTSKKGIQRGGVTTRSTLNNRGTIPQAKNRREKKKWATKSKE